MYLYIMAKAKIKIVERETSVSRSEVREAVNGAFNKTKNGQAANTSVKKARKAA
jgi:hypothetical protein